MAAILPPEPAKSTSPGSPDQAEIIARIMRPVVLRHPGMESVRVDRDVPYAADNELQRLDVYRATGTRNGPAVILIHGWADIQFRPKEWGVFQSWGRLLAARGLPAIMFNHRLGSGGEGRADAARDLAAIRDFVRMHFREYGFDASRLGIMLFSGGGDLLAQARTPDQSVRGVVAYYPLLTRTELPGPATQQGPPTLIVRAGRDDTPGLLQSLDRFISAAQSSRTELILIRHDRGVHGFENDPDDPDAPGIISQTMEFLDKALDNRRTGEDFN